MKWFIMISTIAEHLWQSYYKKSPKNSLDPKEYTKVLILEKLDIGLIFQENVAKKIGPGVSYLRIFDPSPWIGK